LDSATTAWPNCSVIRASTTIRCFPTSFEAELQSAANEPADELLKDLDFSAIDLPGLDDPAPTAQDQPLSRRRFAMLSRFPP
jgi:hypothetical protein